MSNDLHVSIDALQSGLDRLNAAGINLVAALPLDELPSSVQSVLDEEGIVSAGHCRLVLLGNGGGRLWDVIQTDKQRWMRGDAPIDTFSAIQAETFARRTLNDPDWRLIYPGPTRLPLQTLGEIAGWAHESPLGLGIHPGYGLWWAYRAAFLTNRPLPRLAAADSAHPCSTCRDKPCIAACPAAALSAAAAIDLVACSRHRLKDDSSCSHGCLAREACPIGREHRYSRAQIQYHYAHSLTTVKRYFGHE